MPDTRKIGGGRKLNSRQLEKLEGMAFARGWRAGVAAAADILGQTGAPRASDQ